MTQFLDVARGAYAKLPFRTRSQIGAILRFLPAKFRYGATYQAWRDRLARLSGKSDAIRSMQDEARIAVIREAFDKSPYYRAALLRLFGEGFDPRSVLDPAVWAQIPLLSPETVSDLREALCTRPSSDLDSGSTGGTSGKPVRFFLDRGRSPIEYAFVFDAWSRVGYREGDWRAVFRGVEVLESAVEKDSALAELRFSIFNLTDDLMHRFKREIEDAGIVYLHGYPSAIGMFASFLMREGLGPMPKIKAVMLMGERLYPNYRTAIEAAFPNAELVPFFGLSEKCAFAVEVAGKPDTYDFEPLYGFTELLDKDDRPVTVPGQRGRLVSTGLLFKGMPFIRYDTRDEAILVEAPSADNCWKLRVERIVPRRGHEFLVSRDGKLIPILALLVFGKEMDEIREFQFVQDTPGEALIRIVRPKAGPEPEVRPFIDLVHRKSGGLLHLRHEFIDALPISPRAKRRFIDQRLDVSAIENAMNLTPDAVARDGLT